MKCPKCGTPMKDNYCMKCGYLTKGNKIYKIKKDVPDKSKLEEVLGPDYNKFLRRKFNFSAFFFTYYYLIYYRFYILGVFFSVLHFIGIFAFFKLLNIGVLDPIVFFINDWIIFPWGLNGNNVLFLILSFLFHLPFGILFNSLMIRFTRKNPDKCKKHQQVSYFKAFLCFWVEIIVLLGIWLAYIYLGWFHGWI